MSLSGSGDKRGDNVSDRFRCLIQGEGAAQAGINRPGGRRSAMTTARPSSTNSPQGRAQQRAQTILAVVQASSALLVLIGCREGSLGLDCTLLHHLTMRLGLKTPVTLKYASFHMVHSGLWGHSPREAWADPVEIEAFAARGLGWSGGI